MTDIPWGEQPTEEHVWIEDLYPDAFDTSSGWYLLDETCTIYEGKGFEWDSSGEGEEFTIHRKPEPKAFEPVVGEWCEYKHFSVDEHNNTWQKCFFIGLDSSGEHIIRSKLNDELYCDDIEFRPIKSDREVFIEKAMNLLYEGEPSITGIVSAMHKAGFKAPEGDL